VARARSVDFEGDVGTGGVISQDLPQPGQYVGRRIIQIADLPDTHWLDAAKTLGTPWTEALGLTRAESGFWEVSKPEKLTSTWFSRRRKIPRSSSTRTLQLAEATVSRSAREALLQQGSLSSWVRSRGGATTAAKLSDYDSTTGTSQPSQSDGLPDASDKPGGGKGGTVEEETRRSMTASPNSSTA
jgi:hypothetical protein